jgi:hypothetical protein
LTYLPTQKSDVIYECSLSETLAQCPNAKILSTRNW